MDREDEVRVLEEMLDEEKDIVSAISLRELALSLLASIHDYSLQCRIMTVRDRALEHATVSL
jgi:hypothetical protein